MTLARLIRTAVILVLAGLAVAGTWVFLTGGQDYLNALRRADRLYLVPMVGLTVVYLFLRFVRWHYMLRSVRTAVPIRANLSVYLASLVGVATPAHLGELMRSVLMQQRFGTPIRLSGAVLLYERLFDVVALALIGAMTASTWWLSGVMVSLLALALLLLAGGRVVAARVDRGRRVFQNLFAVSTLAVTLAMSTVIWVFAGLVLVLAAASLGTGVSMSQGVGVFSASTLLGGVTLMPAGVAVTGSFAILELQSLDVPLVEALAIVSLTRMGSVGVALLVSAGFGLVEFRRATTPTVVSGGAHFDDIADEYHAQFSEHVWNYLLERKMAFIARQIARLPWTPRRGLDLGCGRGEQCRRLGQQGHTVVGLDASIGLLRHAHKHGAAVVKGDALRLPFGDGSLDYVYTIGVLHHLSSRHDQLRACEEVRRVLKPGGLLLVHETNPRNPLFRFYMAYVFPLVKSIDMGNEIWIDSRWWSNVKGMAVADLVYFTFLPDFIPQSLMKPMSRLERWLESSAAMPYSAHYLAVLKKV
jgi:ubiquinone/menaquinone biosynthesis C-methylase UbiE/uncharacterized membrane protein YbhN (UPF0104 family)